MSANIGFAGTYDGTEWGGLERGALRGGTMDQVCSFGNQPAWGRDK